MIEITFDVGLRGSISHAQTYGIGEYPGGYSFITYYNDDGSLMTESEVREAEKAAEKAEGIRWKEATPLGGDPKDVFNFGGSFNLGRISELSLGSYESEQLTEVIKRIKSGEKARIWYTDIADQTCSFLRLMSIFRQNGISPALLTLVHKSKWQGTAPGDWHKYIGDGVILSSESFEKYADRWDALSAEDAPIRILSEGEIISTVETHYDNFIIEAAKDMKEKPFQENWLVGKVLSLHKELEYNWVLSRIEYLISAGKFTVTKENSSGFEDFKHMTLA